MIPPPDSAPPIAWACYLGADTPERLALVWDVTRRQAAGSLRNGVRHGDLIRLARGRFTIPQPPDEVRERKQVRDRLRAKINRLRRYHAKRQASVA